MGCCPIGSTCSGPSTGCVDPSQVRCPGETFCCRKSLVICGLASKTHSCLLVIQAPGDACYRTDSGLARCGGPASSIPTTSIIRTTATTIRTPTSTIRTPSSTTRTPTTTSQRPPPVVTPPTSVPPSTGFNEPRNQTIPPNSAAITYTGNWQPASSVCDPLIEARKCEGEGNSLSFSFKGELKDP